MSKVDFVQNPPVVLSHIRLLEWSIKSMLGNGRYARPICNRTIVLILEQVARSPLKLL